MPAKFLVVIDSGGKMIARMFDAERRLMADFNGSSSEVAESVFETRPSSSSLA